MRRIGRVLGAAAMTATLATGAFASEKGFRISENWLFSMGYKLWVTAWTTSLPLFVPQSGANQQLLTDNGVPGNIVSASVKYKSLFVSASYMATGKFNFPTTSDVIDNVTGAPGGAGQPWNIRRKMTAERYEYDGNLGYFFNPYFGATVGFKRIEQRFNFKTSGETRSGAAGVLTPGNTNSKTFYNGPTVGVLGGAPIGKGFSLYGNAVAAFLTATYDPKPVRVTGSTNDSALYEGTELGFSWKHRDFPLSASLGYKLQRIETISKDPDYATQHGIDLTTGVTLGLNFQF